MPLEGYGYEYNEDLDISYVLGPNHKVLLSEASSGFQSLVPLYIVSKNLSRFEFGYGQSFTDTLSIKQSSRRNQEIAEYVQDHLLPSGEMASGIQAINKRYETKRFINIVEEPEQNLFPNSQHLILNSLLEFNNKREENKLIMTTHSPYLINYLTLAVKAEMVKQKLSTKMSWDKLAQIIPRESTIKAEDLVIYEMNETDGTIKKLGDYKGLPSDENDLNYELEYSNEIFAQLQEIEKGWR